MNYITRERVHVDRIATAWASRKLVDEHAGVVTSPILSRTARPFLRSGQTRSGKRGIFRSNVALHTHGRCDTLTGRMRSNTVGWAGWQLCGSASAASTDTYWAYSTGV